MRVRNHSSLRSEVADFEHGPALALEAVNIMMRKANHMARQHGCAWLGLAIAALTSSCTLYFGETVDPPVCGKPEPAPGLDYRNPETGQCVNFGGYGGGGSSCGSGVRPATEADPIPQPDWGLCVSECTGLSEDACIARPGCTAAYLAAPIASEDARYWECWAVAPGGHYNRQACESMSAEECNRRDDCSAYFIQSDALFPGQTQPDRDFAACRPERQQQGCYSSDQCPSDTHCTAAEECLPPPDCMPGGACPAVCYGRCVPNDAQCRPDTCAPDERCDVVCAVGGNDQLVGDCRTVCTPNQLSCANVDCAPGYTCEDNCRMCGPNEDCTTDCAPRCVPTQQTCDTTVCMQGSHCELQCWADPSTGGSNGGSAGGTGTAPGTGMDLPLDGCAPVCVPDQNPTCASTTCPVGSHCEERCFPCDPIPGGPACPSTCDVQCVPNGPLDPGACTGEVACDAIAPACPAGTVAGIRNGCWTGYCIPVAECGDSCSVITDEATCRSQMQCMPVYSGADCTCYEDRCECRQTDFARCETR